MTVSDAEVSRGITRKKAETCRALVAQVETELRSAGIASARAEAEWLLAGSLGLQRTELYLREEPLPAPQCRLIRGWLRRRLNGEPLPYLIGYVEFCGYRLTVNESVFIPRPETEILAHEAVQCLQTLVQQGRTAPKVLDVGTGSACLAVTLAHAHPACALVAVELSWDALRVARENVTAHRLAHRIQLIQADWTDGVRGPFDLIVSNPPYVPSCEVAPSFTNRSREPTMSLDGGPEGLRFSHRLLDEAPRLLAPGGSLGVESSEEQASMLARLAARQSWVDRVEVFHDLTGRPRGIWLTRAKEPGVR